MHLIIKKLVFSLLPSYAPCVFCSQDVNFLFFFNSKFSEWEMGDPIVVVITYNQLIAYLTMSEIYFAALKNIFVFVLLLQVVNPLTKYPFL